MQHGVTLMSYDMKNNNNGETGDIHIVKVFPIMKSYCNRLNLMLLELKPRAKNCIQNLVFRLGVPTKIGLLQPEYWIQHGWYFATSALICNAEV